MIIEHPKNKNNWVEGDVLVEGDFVCPGDLFSSCDGNWAVLDLKGDFEIRCKVTDIVFVRPANSRRAAKKAKMPKTSEEVNSSLVTSDRR